MKWKQTSEEVPSVTGYYWVRYKDRNVIGGVGISRIVLIACEGHDWSPCVVEYSKYMNQVFVIPIAEVVVWSGPLNIETPEE